MQGNIKQEGTKKWIERKKKPVFWRLGSKWDTWDILRFMSMRIITLECHIEKQHVNTWTNLFRIDGYNTNSHQH